MERHATPRAQSDGTVASPRLLAATLECANCGRPTSHRILRWDRKGFPNGRRTSGISKCRVCGWTHPFDLVRANDIEIERIVSTGSVSSREKIRLAPGDTLVVGQRCPGADPPLRIRRIDLCAGGSALEAQAIDVATLWVVPDAPPSVPVSILEGARTRTTRWQPDPQLVVEVGGQVLLEEVLLRVTALRARGRTWRRPGDRFRAAEVQRVYGRRMMSPPAGRRAWSRGRESPSSRTSSFSRSARSRSGPGVRRYRTVPRTRNADGGATVHSDSPS